MEEKLIPDNPVFYTPILLLAFNRPEKTQKVFDMIRKVRPQKLYVAVDAPREGRPEDVERSNEVKRIVQHVDWPCVTHYLFQEKNLGCSKSGVTAWDWIFQSEDRMLFIEDDGLATISGFYFIQNLLERYKDDKRIAYVGAVNFGPKYGNNSYYFSRFPNSTYFMGTWKRVHNLYDYNLESFAELSKTKAYFESFQSKSEYFIRQQQFKSYLKSVKENRRINSYDIQMLFLAHAYNMVSIYPNVNLVTNIGFDVDATNYNGDQNSDFWKEYGARPSFELNVIRHPENVLIDTDFEKLFFRKRALFNRNWINAWGKAWFLNHFGTFYKKWIRPIRRGKR